jgi:thymidine kinase
LILLDFEQEKKMAKLHFYYSAMNAGKSTTLLQSNYNYNERGMDTLVLIPAIVNTNKVASRIGLDVEAKPIDPHEDLYQYIKQALNKNNNIKCILIDEAQFLNKNHIQQLAKITIDLNLPVLAYGLRTDFMGEPFEGSKYLLAIADQLIELKTICHCGRKATMNLRVDESGRALHEGEQVEIGGNERYVAVCRRHFLEGTTS